MTVKTLVAAGGAWGTGASWLPSGVPTAADDLLVSAASGSLSLSAVNLCRSVNFTGYTGTFSGSFRTVTLGDGTAGAGNVALEFSAGMTLTGIPSFIFQSTAAAQQTVNFRGLTGPSSVTFNGGGSSYLLTGNVSVGSNLSHQAGILNTNGMAVSVANTFNSSSGTRELVLGASTVTAIFTDIESPGLTFTPGTSTMVCDTSFVTDGLTFNNLHIVGDCSYSGNGIFNVVTIDPNAALRNADSLTFNTLNATGTSGNPTTIDGGTLINSGIGGVSIDFCVISNSTATPALFYAGNNSADLGGNTDWVFTPPPGTGSTISIGYGSLTINGQSAALKFRHTTTAAASTLAISGKAILLKHNSRISANAGTLHIAGEPISLRASRKITAGASTLAIVGKAISLLGRRTLAAAAGTLMLAGKSVTLLKQSRLAASAATLAIMGEPISFLRNLRLPAAATTLSIAGQDAALTFRHTVAADAGALVLLGQDATLLRYGRLGASVGTLALDGQDTILRRITRFVADPASMLLIGQAATFTTNATFVRATILRRGVLSPIHDDEIGTGLLPVVLYGVDLKQRHADEGRSVTFANGVLRRNKVTDNLIL